jgi:U3 small nucleolar RNA-associated protein 15
LLQFILLIDRHIFLLYLKNQIVAVLEELGRRRGLVTALSNRDEESLEPILSFTTKFISDPRYTPLLVGVANQLCDIYSNVFGQSDTIDEYFEKLQLQVKNECQTQSSLLQLIGQIETVMYAAESFTN